jgi:hypothetical protein
MLRSIRRAGSRFWTLTLFALWYFTSGCGGVKMGPFVPPHATACSYDYDCQSGEECRFPDIDSTAVCMWVGESFMGTSW